jgi:large-conductance mechanosensitive channel
MNTIKILKSHLKLILNKSDIIELAAAVYLGTVMGQFLQSIVHGILMPLMHNFIPIEILQQKFQLLNMDFKPVMSNLVSTIIALFLVYLILVLKQIVSQKI